MFHLLLHPIICLLIFVCYGVVGLLATESHQNNTCCWHALSLKTLCLLIRDYFYIMWPLLSIWNLIYTTLKMNFTCYYYVHCTPIWEQSFSNSDGYVDTFVINYFTTLCQQKIIMKFFVYLNLYIKRFY